MEEDPENADNEGYRTKTWNNYAVYVKEVQDWELKRRTRNCKKKNQMDIPELNTEITKMSISVVWPNTDEKIIRKQDGIEYLEKFTNRYRMKIQKKVNRDLWQGLTYVKLESQEEKRELSWQDHRLQSIWTP